MEFSNGMQSENLPHKSGITTSICPRDFAQLLVGKLAPQIGDYDQDDVLEAHFFVGKLAPQIGDYDPQASK